MLRRIIRATIWHPSAIEPDEWKYRNLKRIWLPAYDLLAVWAGLNALVYGSRLLDRILGVAPVDVVGLAFAAVAIVCLAGVAFPRLWAIEMVGKAILVGMIGAYMCAIWLFPATPPEPNWFVITILALCIPLPLFRLNLLGEEWKERHAEESRG